MFTKLIDFKNALYLYFNDFNFPFSCYQVP